MLTLAPTDCREILARLRQDETPHHAAYQCGVELRAIAPYTDGQTARVRDALRRLATMQDTDPDRYARQIARITEHARAPEVHG